MDKNVEVGDTDAAHKPTVAQVFDLKFAQEAVAAAGGRVTIGSCTKRKGTPRSPENYASPHRPAALAASPHAARPAAPARQEVACHRPPRRRLRSVLQTGICPAFCR